MVLTDWTLSSQWGDGSAVLDVATKYAGNSSLRLGAGTGWAKVTHNTFSSTQMQVILWCRNTPEGVGYEGIIHSSYGTLSLQSYYTASTWERFKATFWYDAPSNTRWGRLEKWNGSAWIQQGTDTNFGAGSPATGSLQLRSYGTNNYGWFDELEVYS